MPNGLRSSAASVLSWARNNLRALSLAVLGGVILLWVCCYGVQTPRISVLTSGQNSNRKVLVGEPDSKGITEVPVTVIEEPGLFGDHTAVKFTGSDGKPTSVPLPDGVKHSEVAQVTVVKPTVNDVKVSGTLSGTKPPKVTLDPITLTTDSEGRIYHSGATYTVRVDGGSYQITGTGKVDVQVARREEPTWGLRFRPKFQVGVLPLGILRGDRFLDTLDPGVGVDLAYYRRANLNVSAGVRSVGVDVGLDVTKNFGVYGGARLIYSNLEITTEVGLYFGF